MMDERQRKYAKRNLVNKVAIALSMCAMIFGLVWLVWILWETIILGVGGLTLSTFTQMTPAPNDDGGLANAIYGSFVMVGLATVIGTPIGIMAGIYLAEYSPHSRLSNVTRFVNEILLSAPSIVIGLFIYAAYVAPAGHYSGWAGALALSILVVPVVVRTTDNMLMLVPNGLREACFAIGCPKWKMIVMVSYKSAKSGIMTGILLVVARIAGETAPLLFTALNNQFMSWDMNKPLSNLPVVIYQFASSPFKDWNDLAWAGATLITLAVLALNIIARNFLGKK